MTDEIIIEALRIAAESEKNPALKMLLEIAAGRLEKLS
jgi:hypothetical protein|tara:strand:- start:61 stop:174 length:114 start_codon:yes stop_codon:yes gene_type:complete